MRLVLVSGGVRVLLIYRIAEAACRFLGRKASRFAWKCICFGIISVHVRFASF